MNGVDFLEAAMDLVPQARRRCSPRTPTPTRPSPRSTWSTSTTTCSSRGSRRRRSSTRWSTSCWPPGSGRASRPSTGSRSSAIPGRAASYEVRDFLARNLVPYRWLHVDEPEGAQLLAAAGAEASQAPVVITTDGAAAGPAEPGRPGQRGRAEHHPGRGVLRPGDRRRRPGRAGRGGVRGLGGPEDRDRRTGGAGGQAGQSSRIENYLGFPDGVAGDQLTERARRQALRFGAELLTARSSPGSPPRVPAREVTFDDGSASGRTRWCWPPGSATASSRPRAPTTWSAAGSTTARPRPRRRLHRPARDHRRRGQLGRPGRGVLLPVRGEGDHGRPRRLAGTVDVVAT